MPGEGRGRASGWEGGRQAGRPLNSWNVKICSLTPPLLSDLSSPASWDRENSLIVIAAGPAGWGKCYGLSCDASHLPWRDASSPGELPGGAVGLWWCFSLEGDPLSRLLRIGAWGPLFHCGPEKVFGSDRPRLGSHIHHLMCDFGQITRTFSNLVPQL